MDLLFTNSSDTDYVWITCELRMNYVWITCELRVNYVWITCKYIVIKRTSNNNDSPTHGEVDQCNKNSVGDGSGSSSRKSSIGSVTGCSPRTNRLTSSRSVDTGVRSKSPYRSPSGSPRLRRQPTRETRSCSISDGDGYIQLNQYQLKDQIGKVGTR